ncbi:phosphoribosylanthranilate isomerase [Maribacter sp. CXY002]|uniref:phosphoribosylanthranilate isomerase n=1 Tax=Maribacter luteocoastalis TaxID=3407671 RepID=UPI003B66C83F
MKLKVCGMNSNILEVAAIKPNYLGFIFWEPSSRFFHGKIPDIPDGIKRIGVFVDESIPKIVEAILHYDLNGVQLHGNESATYCKALKEVIIEHKISEHQFDKVHFDIIKVFSIKDNFDFDKLALFEDVCDYFLFDTKGKLPGGNGYAFDWSVLKNYPSTKPYFLSGGIGLENTDELKHFLTLPESKYCYAIDVNSKFEIEPGLKDIEKIKNFKKILTEN